MTDVPEMVAGVTTTLLCGASMGGETRDCCESLLASGAADGREVRGVLAVGDAPHWETAIDGVDVEVVATPGDITALGIKLSRFLSGGDGELTVCFDSVTAMCQYVEPETAYGFLHTIAVQLYAADATAHFHVDAAAHDESTVDLFASLCDAVVDVSDDEPTVRTRPAIE